MYLLDLLCSGFEVCINWHREDKNHKRQTIEKSVRNFEINFDWNGFLAKTSLICSQLFWMNIHMVIRTNTCSRYLLIDIHCFYFNVCTQVFKYTEIMLFNWRKTYTHTHTQLVLKCAIFIGKECLICVDIDRAYLCTHTHVQIYSFFLYMFIYNMFIMHVIIFTWKFLEYSHIYMNNMSC